MFILRSQQSCEAVCSLWLSFPSLPSSLCLSLLSVFSPPLATHPGQNLAVSLWLPPGFFMLLPAKSPPAAKQTPSFNCSQIPGWRTLAPERGKGYYKLNALNTTHTRQILSYPRLNSPKHVAIHRATNRLAKPGDLRRTMQGGPVAATARQVPIRTQIAYLFCQDGTRINVCRTTAVKS